MPDDVKPRTMPLYRAMAHRLAQIANLQEAARPLDDPFLVEAKQALKDLIDELPHGSGIDCDWHVTGERPGGEHGCKKLILRNSYHHMDECGGYDGWTDFKVTVTGDLLSDIDVLVQGRFPAKYADTRDYLCEILTHALKEEVEP